MHFEKGGTGKHRSVRNLWFTNSKRMSPVLCFRFKIPGKKSPPFLASIFGNKYQWNWTYLDLVKKYIS